MGERNNKIILTSLIIILAIIAVVFIVMIAKKDSQLKPQPTPPTTEAPQAQTEEMPEDEVIPLTEEKKAEFAVIENTTGTITSVDTGAIVVSTAEGEDLTLKIPEEGANFVTQTVQEDGAFLMEEIGLFDIPEDSEADIQYNGSTNEVMLVTIK
ncbi:MAG: hypothetical protein PF549_04005 [Patescibacteria group bacterium]|jgi:energy-converting hydrogenase Eha subunit F|nr:hypothetical protein [Patescibacteria group bacterium]